MEVFCKATYMQMGLSRQCLREQQNRPGYKVDGQGSLTDGVPQSSDAGQGASSKRFMVSDSVEQVASPTKMDGTEGWTPSVNCQTEQEGRGNMVQSPICDIKQGSTQHEAVDANVNAHLKSATPAIDRNHTFNLPPPPHSQTSQASQASNTECSHQELREQSQHNQAEVGQHARDIIGARHSQTIS